MLKLLLCGLIAGPPCLLVAAQPQLGGVIVWGPVMLAMLFVGGIPLRYLLALVLLAVGRAAHRGPPAQTVSIPAADDFPQSRPRPARGRLEHPAIHDRHRFRRLARQGIQGARHAGRNRTSCPRTSPTRISFFRSSAKPYGFRGGAALLVVLAMLLVTVLYIAYQAKDQLGPDAVHRRFGPAVHTHFHERRA